ncbi:hypothetical protein EN804_06100 [Mesorhizobium sp. M8A.F.Ca.ET.161.01.1.1]|nr:hypothetical protein EN804_06100 [Mesorhizobium sp. M8A.F.Ca.ET.161.01.1.1]TGV44077.1 hypothetical protein EN785_07445 [Mesorhizobium sp. M8A.F.Ca.ET.142.01.1.1]
MHEIARQAAREAVKETFITLGLDPDKPLEAQADMQFLRNWRESTGTVKRQTMLTAAAVVTAGILGLIWLAIKGTPSP